MPLIIRRGALPERCVVAQRPSPYRLKAHLTNVRVLDGDARELMANLPDASPRPRAFVLFPDPWPKTRHHKRRVIQADSVAELARLLKPGGSLRFASDVAHYVDWALALFVKNPAFPLDRRRRRPTGATRPPTSRLHHPLRGESASATTCAPVFLDFVRTCGVVLVALDRGADQVGGLARARPSR